MKEFDLVIIGGGIAGYSAALRASNMGASVCLVEKDRVGGTYFFNGLHPLRTVLRSVGLMGGSNPAVQMEWRASDNGTSDYQSLISKAGSIAESLSKGAERILQAKGITLLRGIGQVTNGKTVRVEKSEGEESLQTKAVILAMGSEPKSPQSFPFDDPSIVPSDSLLGLKEIPPQVLIVGGQTLGCELATVLNRLGAKVFLCEDQTRILSNQHPEIINLFEEILKKQKLKLLLNKNILSILKKEGNIDISLDGGIKFSVGKIFVVGKRRPVTESLKSGGMRLGEHEEIFVDEKMQTSEPGIYAIGGVVRGSHHPERSEEEARIAVGNALGKDRILNPDRISRIIYSDPELVSIGCFGHDSHHHGFRGIEGSCRFEELDFFSEGIDQPGLVKLVADKSSRKVIGCHLLCSGASEILPSILLAIKKELTVNDLGNLASIWPLRFNGVRYAAKQIMDSLKSLK